MNYQKIHDAIIHRAMNRERPDCYCEKHHIVMRCKGGGDEKSNIAVLTAREHFIIHWLLYKIYRDLQSSYAFFYMTKPVGNGRTRYTSTSFKYAREAAAKFTSIAMSGENSPHWGKFGKDSPSYGTRRTPEQKRRISEAAKRRYARSKHPVCVPVVCVETGERFDGASQAKRKNGGNIGYALRSGGTAKGYHYVYEDPSRYHIPEGGGLKGYAKGARHQNSRKVMNTSTGKVFASIKLAAEDFGVSGTAISIAIKEDRPCKGVVFRHV